MSVIGSPRANAGSKRPSANLARSFLRFQKMQSVTPTMINTPKAAPTTPPMMGIMLGFLPGKLFTCRKKSGTVTTEQFQKHIMGLKVSNGGISSYILIILFQVIKSNHSFNCILPTGLHECMKRNYREFWGRKKDLVV